MSTRSALAAQVLAWSILVAARPARAADDPPVHAFAQAGIGLVEFGNVKAGVFLGPHLTLEGMATWAGVFGSRYGGGVTGFFGHTQGLRPPRNSLTVGARLMLNSNATFDSGGDDLSSYVAFPVGYSFIGDSGVFFTLTLGPVLVRERTSWNPTPTTTAVSHKWAVSGPLFNLGVGFVFPRPSPTTRTPTPLYGR